MNSSVRRSTIQGVFAFASLAIGACVYFFDREPAAVYFMQHWLSKEDTMPSVFGWLGNHLPAFLHVYAFTLLTIAVVKPSRVCAIVICASWFVVDSLFELGQAAALAQKIASHVPSWFDGVPFLENTSSYFINGTFDPVDLCSIAIGSLAAYLTFVVSSPREHGSASAI
jgi:hypothetical protein